MNAQKRHGFTIIEVMLFLAITGALTVGILVGSGATIGRQRYRDSVNTFKGVIQEQYSQVANVVNSEPQNPNCVPANPTLLMDGDTLRDRGTSDCLVMGRFLLVQPTVVTSYNLVGQLDPTFENQDIEGGDTAVLSHYFMTVQSPEQHQVSWSARIVRPETTNGMTAGILVVRSPISGSILTYSQDIEDGIDADDYDRLSTIMQEMIQADSSPQKDFCVDSDGGLLARARRQAVRIKARAANQSAIEIPLESEGVCD